MTGEEILRSMHNCARVRSAYPVRFVQVLPDPDFADNVRLRLGPTGPWRTMHYIDAIALMRLTRQKQRRKALLDEKTKSLRRAFNRIKQRHEIVQGREREWNKRMDSIVKDTLVRGQSLLKKR